MAISPQIPDSAFGHALNLWTPAHPVLLQRLLNKHGNFEKAYRATAEKTKYIDVGGEFTKLEKLGIKLLSSQDKNYPKLLGAVPDSPALLYYRGSMDVTDELSLAVVGTRRASDYGRQVTPRLVRPIAECGVTIVSGLAYGIDSFAHEATLECDGRTIAVLPGGLDDESICPPNHLGLARKILAAGGALVSEYAPGVFARKHHFLARNRIIAGLAAGSLIIECDVKSGALITARHALDYNRNIYAVPGPIYSVQSRGPNELIKRGAMAVTSADDILDDMRVPAERREAAQISGAVKAASSPSEAAILAGLRAGPRQRDEIIKTLGLAPAEIMASLTFLEIKGIIKQFDGENYGLITNN